MFLQGDELLKSCWCKIGHIRIPESKGCYDPIRKVVTLRDACFADYHCNDLPNTVCAYDVNMERYNKSCQCLPGNKLQKVSKVFALNIEININR